MKKLLVILLVCIIPNIIYSQVSITYSSPFKQFFSISNKRTFHFSNGSNMTLVLRNLGSTHIGLNVDILIKHAVSDSTIYVYNNIISSSGNGSLMVIDNASNWGIGQYYLEIVEHAPPNTPVDIFQDHLIVIENIKYFNKDSMQFQIHYHNDAFINHPSGISHTSTYINNLEQIIKDVWDREVNDWNLCQSIPAVTGGSGTNKPKDGDNIYHFIVHNISETLTTYSFKPDFFWSYPIDNNRMIFLDSRINHNLNSTNDEKELLYMTVAHEFFHGIQFSHVPYSGFGTTTLAKQIEIGRRSWLIEGQAKFLETVFMHPNVLPAYNYSTTDINTCYSNLPTDFSYIYYTSDVIDRAYGSTYSFDKLNDIGYNYAIFWRHLFEHNFPAGTTLQDKMALLRETCIDNTTSVPANIETNIMDNNLSSIGGNFTTFDDALIDFTEKLYFHDTAWFHNFPAPLWDDPNSNNFYKTITAFTEPIELLTDTSRTYNYSIPSSFAHRSHRFMFSTAQPVKLSFKGDTTGTADFYVKYYVMKDDTIRYSNEMPLTHGKGEAKVCIRGAQDRLLFLVTRLDPFEGSAPGDYEITLEQAIRATGYNWPLDSDNNPANGLDFGKQHKIIGQFADCRSSGTVNRHHILKGVEIDAPAGTGVYAVDCGVAHVGTDAVNIGHFRYANLTDIAVAEGSFVNIGDLIGKTNYSNRLYFLENEGLLATASEIADGWQNPIRYRGLTPYSDTVKPVIQSIHFVNAAGEVTPELYGKLDIIVDAYDPAVKPDGTADVMNRCGINKIEIAFFDEWFNKITGTEMKQYSGFNLIPLCSITQLYAPGSDARTFKYIATNDPFNAPYDGYWNTRQKKDWGYTMDAALASEALFPEGKIKIQVIVIDLQNNITMQYFP